MKFKKIITGTVAALALSPFFSNISSQVHAQEDTLIIYSNSVSNGRGEWVTKKAEEAGIKIQMVELPGAELADRVIAEKNNGIADIVWGISALDSNKLRDQDILSSYEPDWKSEISEDIVEPNGFYYPVVEQPLVLIGNPDVENMPTDWTELGVKYQGKYAISALTGGTPRMILASLLTRYQDENGELGVSEEGWNVVKDYIQNAYILQKGESGIVKILDDSDPVVYSMMWGTGALAGQKEHNVVFKVMTPEIGVPVVTENISITASSTKKELALKFINWFGSTDVQKQYSAEFGAIPTNASAKAELPEDTKALMDQITQQTMDWEFIGKYLDQWVEKVELEFVQ